MCVCISQPSTVFLFLGLNLPIVVHHIQEVRTLTQSQDLAPRGPAPTLDPSAARTLVPIHDHLHTPGEAEARAGTTVQGPDLMDITDLGQGHLHIDVTIHGQDLLKHLGDSLPLNAMYLKAKPSVSILIDTEKFHPLTTSKPIMDGVSTLETHLRKNATGNGRGNTESGMKSTTKGMLWGHSLDPRLTERTSPQRDFYLLISEILPSQEGAEKTMLLDKVIEIGI